MCARFTLCRISQEDKHFIWLEQNREQRRRKRQRSRHCAEPGTAGSKPLTEELTNSANGGSKVSVESKRRDADSSTIQKKNDVTVQEQHSASLSDFNDTRERVSRKDPSIESEPGEVGKE